VQGQEVVEGGKDVEKGEKPYAGERCEPEAGHFEAGWRVWVGGENREEKGGYEVIQLTMAVERRLART
jgi:hypothetical protein